MKKMKLTKKLIPAIGMLMLSAVMLVTSSFAWFSVNTDVTAKGMSVTAKADQVFLQISNSTTFDAQKSMMSANAPDATKQATLLPTNVVESLDGGAVVAYKEGSAAKDTVKWVKNYSKEVDKPGPSGTYEEIGAAKDYYLLNTFYLRLNPAAGKVTADKPLTSTVALTGEPTDNLSKTVSVLVKCGTLAQLWKQVDGAWVNKADDTLTAGNFANIVQDDQTAENADGPVAVEVYIFFDGDNANCTTANAVNLSAYSVEVYFSVAK
jgi:hypothetical protein